MIVPLNPEQEAAAEAVQGNVVTIAGPGTGKTTVLVNRYLRMITKHGISPADILNLTFTAEAARNMVERVGLFNAERVFRTFHSFALELITKEKEHLPFAVGDFVLPQHGQDFQLLKDLMKMYPAITSFRSLKDEIARYKASNITPEQAMNEAWDDKKGVQYFYAAAYRDYEIKCREQGWLDFDSLMREAVKLLETNDAVRARWQRKYICVDEAQDTDVIQAKLLRLIYGGNIFFVGDANQLVYEWRSAQDGNLDKFIKEYNARVLYLGANYRCHPPGVKIECCVGQSREQRKSKAITKKLAVEHLSKNTKAVSWDKRNWHVHLRGRQTSISTQEYDGRLYILQTEKHKSLPLTANHDVFAKIDINKAAGKHAVYLMWRSDKGFRIGKTALVTKYGINSRNCVRLWHRVHTQRPEKAWILEVVGSSREAFIREQFLSSKYGITQTSFVSERPDRGGRFTEQEIDKIFSYDNRPRGTRCLDDFELDFSKPLLSYKNNVAMSGYIKTSIKNVIPTLMKVPTRQNLSGETVTKIVKSWYSGTTYSLDVDVDHNYFANDICVANSNGAVVEFLKKILPVDNGLASHMVSMREYGEKPSITKYNSDIVEAEQVLSQIKDLNNTAVIARTNHQLRQFQRTAMARGIKTMILGQKDLWQTNEVKHLLDLAKPHKSDPRPAHEVLTRLMNDYNLNHVYRNTGGPNEKPPVENLADIIRLAANRGTTKEFLDWLRRLTFACQESKKPGYEHRDKNPVLTLSTAHQMKGREAKHVYVIGVNQGMMPHKEGELLEEKRVWFVACSRAGDDLHISYWGNRSEFLNDFQKEIKQHDDESKTQLASAAASSTRHSFSSAELSFLKVE